MELRLINSFFYCESRSNRVLENDVVVVLLVQQMLKLVAKIDMIDLKLKAYYTNRTLRGFFYFKSFSI